MTRLAKVLLREACDPMADGPYRSSMLKAADFDDLHLGGGLVEGGFVVARAKRDTATRMIPVHLVRYVVKENDPEPVVIDQALACKHCGKVCRDARGLSSHVRHCERGRAGVIPTSDEV